MQLESEGFEVVVGGFFAPLRRSKIGALVRMRRDGAGQMYLGITGS